MAITPPMQLAIELAKLESVFKSHGLELHSEDGQVVFAAHNPSGGLISEFVCYLKSIEFVHIVQECRFTVADATITSRLVDKMYRYLRAALNRINREKQSVQRRVGPYSAYFEEVYMDEANRLSPNPHTATEIMVRERELREEEYRRNRALQVEADRRIARAVHSEALGRVDRIRRPGLGAVGYPHYSHLDPASDTQSAEEKFPKRRIKLPPE